jgi:hypothetical protein
MKRCTLASLLIAALVLLEFSSPAGAAKVKSWYVDSLIKIFPSDAAGSHRLASAELLAARGQHVSMQLEVRSKQPLERVVAEIEPLINAQGKTLGGASVRPEGYVVVASHTRNTPDDERIGEAPALYPDPLLDFPVNIPANRTQSLWIGVAVPIDATPGDYHGAVLVRAGGRKLVRHEFSVKVLAVTVPDERTLKITNWFSFNDKVSQHFYGIKEFTPDWWVLIDNIAHVMAAHRQNMVLTPLMSLIQPRVEGDHIAYDFTNFDRWVETFRNAGAIGYIEGSHLLERGAGYDGGVTLANTFQIEDGKIVKRSLPADDARVEAFFAGFLAALNAHLDDKGWKTIYYQHIMDEAHGTEPPYYARVGGLVHRYLPGVPTMDAVDAKQVPDELQKNCDVWVPQLGRFDNQMDLMSRRMASGHPVWFYTCMVPTGHYMNRQLDAPLLKVRLLQWLNYRYGLAGYLHWGWNEWTPDPMLDTQPIIGSVTILPPGDAFVVYPDRAGKSVFSSIRLETMTQGIEDYEMLQALKARNPVEADHLGKEAIAGFTDYVRDPSQFRSIERQLLEELAK